jgi:ABC-type phosphate/phosphonate transport system permease subunit
MGVPGVTVIVRMAGMAMTVIVAMVVRMPGHEPILPASKLGRPFRVICAVIRHFDTAAGGMD